MRAFAQALELSPGQLSELMRGKRKLTLKGALKIAQKLNLAPEESERFLDELNAFTCQAPRVYRQRWTPGDVVMFVAYLDRLYSPIDALNEIAVSLQQYMASLLRAVRLLDTGPTEAPGAHRELPEPDVIDAEYTERAA